jgi:hypothetical protein
MTTRKSTIELVEPRFPNLRSQDQTIITAKIDIHYADLGIVDRWTWERFNRMAAFLRLQHAELASLICLRHTDMRRAKKEDRFPGPAALLLTLMEAQFMSEYIATIKNPFPNLNALPEDP